MVGTLITAIVDVLLNVAMGFISLFVAFVVAPAINAVIVAAIFLFVVGLAYLCRHLYYYRGPPPPIPLPAARPRAATRAWRRALASQSRPRSASRSQEAETEIIRCIDYRSCIQTIEAGPDRKPPSGAIAVTATSHCVSKDWSTLADLPSTPTTAEAGPREKERSQPGALPFSQGIEGTLGGTALAIISVVLFLFYP
jgi:hypothetical protein